MFGLRVVKATKKQIMKEGWGQRLFQLFNEAFAPLYGTSIYSKDQTEDYLRQYVPLLDLELVPFILNEKDEIVGAAVTMRDLSPALNKTHGRLLPLGWVHLAKALITKKAEKAQLMIIAVRPDMQGLGLNALIFDDLIPIYNRIGIKWCETNPQLESNVKELSQWKPLNPEMVKRRRCWQKEMR
jgi:GNAT superfamily N-acetyltransferase